MATPCTTSDHQYRLQQAIDQHAHNTTDSVVIIWSVRFRDIFQNRFASTRTTGWERIGNDNRILCRTVMQFGATSGVDCLAGMLHGFEP